MSNKQIKSHSLFFLSHVLPLLRLFIFSIVFTPPRNVCVIPKTVPTDINAIEDTIPPPNPFTNPLNPFCVAPYIGRKNNETTYNSQRTYHCSLWAC